MFQKFTVTLMIVFSLGLAVSIIWEFAHSVLYVHYRGGDVSSLVLVRAALFDAFFVTMLAVPMLFVPFLRKQLWIALVVGIAFSTGLELYALETGRWAYTEAMPLVPYLNTGLTPTFQLGFSSWLIYALMRRYDKELFLGNTVDRL